MPINMSVEFPKLQQRVSELTYENERLKQSNMELLEALKVKNDNLAALALEFGYKQCEKGNNIQMAFSNYNKISKHTGE